MDRLGHRCIIDVLPKVDVIDIDVISHEPGPQFGPLRYTSPDRTPIRVAIVGEFHSLLPVGKKICNLVQHPRCELIIRRLSRGNGVVDKNESFPKVEEHHAHCRTVAVGILIPVVEHAD